MAGFICAFACVSALGLFQRFRQAKDDRGWGLTLTAFVAGAGVWSTHFVAMLAYDPHLPMSFDVFGTATSLVYVILGMGVGFTLALRGTGGRVAGAIVAGLSIGAMHYAGILAVRLQGHIHWRPTFVVMSILVAVGLNIASFVALGPRPRRSRWAAAAALLMAEILSLHFTGMAAMSVTPDPTIALDGGSVERPVVAVAVTLVSLALLAAPFAVLAIEQRARRQMLSTLRRSLNAVPAGMAFFDERDRLTAWNAPWADVAHSLDLEPAEGLPRSVMLSAARTAGWIPPSDQDKDRLYDHLKGWRELAAADVRMPDGRWMRHQQFRLEGGGGVTTFTDVTAQKELVAALTTAKDAAEAANAAKTAFLANISHEIRTPLNGVLGAAELLGRRPLDLEEHKLVDMLQTSGRVLSDLLDEVLDLSRIEAGAIEIRPQPADLAALLADVRQVHAAAAAMKGIDLRLRIAEGAGERVECDANRLGQVLGNLLNNAIKFTDKGRVTLSAERDGASVTFRVSDTGIGFTAAQKRRLFERFSQADPSSTRARGGAGLGLAIAKELVALMGGDLDGVSRPGEGSTFDFTLDLPAIGTVDAAQPLQGPAHAGRVLIVDDNAINRQVLATILNATGIEYAEAADGAEALAAFGQESFSAILMDIQMPVMDGWEATRRIRDLERSTGRPRTPIFMVSANGLQGHVDASLAAGADDHFPKPVPIARLLAALEPCVEPVSKVA